MRYTPFRTGEVTIDRNLDSIKASIDSLDVDAMVSPITLYTMTIGATTTPPTKGYATFDKASYQVVGNMMTLRYDYNQQGAGAAGSGVYLFPLPPNYELDSSLIFTGSGAGLGIVGIAQVVDTGSIYNGSIQTFSKTSFSLKFDGTTAGTLFDMSSTNAPLSSASIQLSFVATMPVKRI